MKKNILLIPIYFLILFNLGCKKSPTEVIDNTQPGRRDYVWKVDTLNYPYNTIYRIWGSSPTDVWAVSPGGDLDKTIFHFDGNRWTTDGISRPISPSAIWGFTNDNIYIGGGNGRIWKNTGSGWHEDTVLTKDGNSQIVFDGMWGDSPNNFFAFGASPDKDFYSNNCVLVQCVNNNWTMLNTNGIQGKGIVEDFYKNKTDGKIYLRSLQWNKGNSFDSMLVFEYSNSNFSKIYAGTWEYDQAANLSLIDGEVYFSLGRKIAKRINNEFITVLNLENTNYDNDIWGRNSKDIFLRMTDGLTHYNGSDIEYLLHFDKPRTSIFSAALFEKEVFFIVYEAQTNLNLIYHGVLK
ncbi:MAG: hypothetical protein COW85_12150 [Ignavibacteria bacterium CG22_combo_CG10-13_8_21_14_all_37_15]|nr:MAG: hypothetical protein COW85_12150 [Ignavibacteria bacterium CG22_combo_CG10-13_8_21_14_all_37_15]